MVMKISNVQNYYPSSIKRYSQKTQFKGSSFGTYDFSCEYGYEKYARAFWEKLQNNKEYIYAHLDNLTIDMEGKKAPIKEHVNGMFRKGNKNLQKYSFFHRTYYPDEIVKNGFDFTKINQTKYGPGMYFSCSEGEVQIYNGTTLKADFEGTTAIGDDLDKYEQLLMPITTEIRKYFGMSLGYTPEGMTEYHVLKKFCDQYVRNIIVNKLNIDGATCYGGRYFIVFNPKSLSNIRKY